MGEPSSSGRLRQLELHRVLSTAMHNEGIAYRTLCFTLYGRVSGQHCASLFGHVSTLSSRLSCMYYCADIQASSDGQGNCSFLPVLPQRTRADEQPVGCASAPGLTFVMTSLVGFLFVTYGHGPIIYIMSRTGYQCFFLLFVSMSGWVFTKLAASETRSDQPWTRKILGFIM